MRALRLMLYLGETMVAGRNARMRLLLGARIAPETRYQARWSAVEECNTRVATGMAQSRRTPDATSAPPALQRPPDAPPRVPPSAPLHGLYAPGLGVPLPERVEQWMDPREGEA